MPVPSRRLLWTVAFAAALSLPLVPALHAQSRPGGRGRRGGRGGGQGRPATPAQAPPPSPILSFHAVSGNWLWLQNEGPEVSLYSGGPSGSPKLVARGNGWRDAVPSRDGGWILSWSGDKGALLRFSGSGAPEPVLSIGRAAALRVEGEDVYWVEAAPAPSRAFGWIVPAAAGCSIRSRSKEGTVRTLTTIPGGDPEGGAILGISGGKLYAALRRPACTELYRVPLAGGEAEWLAGEEGAQNALLANDTLYWTAPSEEASPADLFHSIRRLTASGGVETLTDWLPGNGGLWVTSQGIEYAGDRRWRIPSSFGPAGAGPKVPPGQKWLDGDTVIRLEGQHAPAVAPPGQQTQRPRLDVRETPAC